MLVKDGISMPDRLLFRAGGDNSVRGYAYRSLGPTLNGRDVGGRALLTASPNSRIRSRRATPPVGRRVRPTRAMRQRTSARSSRYWATAPACACAARWAACAWTWRVAMSWGAGGSTSVRDCAVSEHPSENPSEAPQPQPQPPAAPPAQARRRPPGHGLLTVSLLLPGSSLPALWRCGGAWAPRAAAAGCWARCRICASKSLKARCWATSPRGACVGKAARLTIELSGLKWQGLTLAWTSSARLWARSKPLACRSSVST